MRKQFLLAIVIAVLLTSCNLPSTQQTSDSGVVKASVKVVTDANGETIEQRNYKSV